MTIVWEYRLVCSVERFTAGQASSGTRADDCAPSVLPIDSIIDRFVGEVARDLR